MSKKSLFAQAGEAVPEFEELSEKFLRNNSG